MSDTLLIGVVGDVVWQALIAALLAIVLAVINVWQTKITKKAIEDGTKQNAETAKGQAVKVQEAATLANVAASKVEEVRIDLKAASEKADGKIDSLARVADATHILVNNNMQIALDSYATMARRMATATGDPKDIEIAEAAEQALVIHKGKQANLDSAEAGRATP